MVHPGSVSVSSIAARVRERVENDVILAGAVSRGIVNYRAAARWLVETRDWDVSEGAVISALRRLTPSMDETFDQARDVLEQSHVNTRAQMCSVRLPGVEEIRRRLPEFHEIVDAGQGEVLRVISSDQGFKVLLDEKNLEAVEEAIDPGLVQEVKRDLTELDVVIPPEARTTPGILALVCNKLALHGINIAETVDGVHQHILLVSSRDAIEAHRLLTRLTEKEN